MISNRRGRKPRLDWSADFSSQLTTAGPGLSLLQRLLLLVIVLAVGWLIWLLLFSSWLRVDSIKVEGLKAVDEETVLNRVPIIGQNILRLAAGQYEERLRQLPLIADVALIRVLPREIKVVVRERQPALVWKTTDQLYEVDHAGIPFLAVEDVAEGLWLVEDSVNVHVNLGEQAVPRSVVTAVLTLAAELPSIYSQSGTTLSNFMVGETAFDLDAKFSDGRVVKFNILSNYGSQLAELRRLRDQRPDLFGRPLINLTVDRWAYIQ